MATNFPTWSFDWNAELEASYQALKPFYEKLLDFSGGKLDLAKRVIDYTYQQGMRESTQQAEQERSEQALTFPVEQQQLTDTQNRRGVLTSGFGQTEQRRLQESQGLRREATERALANRESRLASEKSFGLEEKQNEYKQDSFNLEREKRQEATGMTQDKFGIKQAEYSAAMQKAQIEEQRRLQEEANAATKKYYEAMGVNL